MAASSWLMWTCYCTVQHWDCLLKAIPLFLHNFVFYLYKNEATEEKKTLKYKGVVKNTKVNDQTINHPQCLQIKEPNISKENSDKIGPRGNVERKHNEVAENQPVEMTLRNDDLFFQSNLKAQTTVR